MSLLLLWLIGLLGGLIVGLILGFSVMMQAAARERGRLYQQWLHVSPGRALRALRERLCVSPGRAAAGYLMTERVAEIEAGSEPTHKELILLLRSLAHAAERPQA